MSHGGDETPELRNGRLVCNQLRLRTGISRGFQPLQMCLGILAIADPDWFNFSDGPTVRIWARGGLDALKNRLAKSIRNALRQKLSAIVIEIRLQGDIAYDYGWHELTLTAQGRRVRPIRPHGDRYVDIWRERQGRQLESCGCIWITRTSLDSEPGVSPSGEGISSRKDL